MARKEKPNRRRILEPGRVKTLENDQIKVRVKSLYATHEWFRSISPRRRFHRTGGRNSRERSTAGAVPAGGIGGGGNDRLPPRFGSG